MRNTFVPRAGGVLSADIAVPEHEREVAFYSKVLTTGESPLWRDDLMNNRGMPIIGLGVRTPEYDGLPLQWMPHFQVTDVAASAAKAVEMGGQEIMHGKGEDGQSQWAVLVDPQGAGFGIIPVVEDEAYSIEESEELGCVSWLALHVADAATSSDFYQNVLGWNPKAIEMPGVGDESAKFEMQIDEETSAAEICPILDSDNSVPAVWLIHLPVDDLAESLRQVTACGGEVVKECVDTSSAIIRDPVGVYFALQAG